MSSERDDGAEHLQRAPELELDDVDVVELGVPADAIDPAARPSAAVEEVGAVEVPAPAGERGVGEPGVSEEKTF